MLLKMPCLIDIYDIVTNGTTWQFYKLDLNNQVWETLTVSIGNIENILGQIDYVFAQCEHNLSKLN